MPSHGGHLLKQAHQRDKMRLHRLAPPIMGGILALTAPDPDLFKRHSEFMIFLQGGLELFQNFFGREWICGVFMHPRELFQTALWSFHSAILFGRQVVTLVRLMRKDHISPKYLDFSVGHEKIGRL